MDQPVLTATIALAIAVSFTAAIAIVILAAKTLGRAIKLTVVGAIIALAVVALQRVDLRINFTGSMPIGIYSLSPLPDGSVTRGMLVAACAPARAAELGWQRGYFAFGPCAHHTELLLKSIAAMAGDDVDITAAGVAVDGCLLPHSQPVRRDRFRRPLLSWPQGHYRMVRDQLWLYAPNDRSWDSRYWGPISIGAMKAAVTPVLVETMNSYRRIISHVLSCERHESTLVTKVWLILYGSGPSPSSQMIKLHNG